MIITKKNYGKILSKLDNENLILSEQFFEMLEKLKIKNFNIATVGNSISSGYSKCDRILPLIMRSHIYKLSKETDIDVNFYSYARIRRNEDYNVLRWYNSNITHDEINDLNISDIAVKSHAYVDKYWEENTLNNYKTMTQNGKMGFKDFIFLDNNIVIYNGLTGGFTNAVRKGKITDKLKILQAFKKDIEDAKLNLIQFYLDNPNVQVYVCGLPNIMGTGIISILDRYIKKMFKNLPNVVYVPGVIRNSFFYLDGQKEFDVHYSQPEYLHLLNNITRGILENYTHKKFENSLLTKLENYSRINEKESTTSQGCEIEVLKIIREEIEKYVPILEADSKNIDLSIDRIMDYYDRNYLAIYPCTPREKVLDILDGFKK